MHAKICRYTLAMFMGFFHRKFRQLGRGIYLEQQGFENVRKLLQAGERVVLMPVYRSFSDLPVLLYCLFVNKIEIPFTIGNSEDLPSASVINGLLKRIGYVISKRSRGQALQQSYIN